MKNLDICKFHIFAENIERKNAIFNCKQGKTAENSIIWLEINLTTA